MTSIKCKYVRYRCGRDYYSYGSPCKHHSRWSSDSPIEYDDCCDYADARPLKVDSVYEIPLRCRNMYLEDVMFEKCVKSFWLDENELLIGRRSINVADIVELIIDGRMIIGEEEGRDEEAD